jgi:Ca2+-transporting ATPase
VTFGHSLKSSLIRPSGCCGGDLSPIRLNTPQNENRIMQPPQTGLSEREAAERLKRDGYNDIPSDERRSALRIVLGVLREPMFALLLGAAAIYLMLGDLWEALLLAVFATVSVSVAVIQETRSERVLERLRALSSPRALVVRDGEYRRIPGREVVSGDFMLIAEGDRVPADARLVRAADLQLDESLLTGESVPVRKKADGDNASQTGGDLLSLILAGTLVISGTACAIVTATGPRSAIGKIGQSLASIEIEPPRLHAQVRRVVQFAAVAGLGLSAAAVLLHGFLRGSWIEALLSGIGVAMSLLPEEFPLVLAVFVAMGAWRISRAGVLTRKAAAIETLGAATVLCADKTGTLTMNRMSVARLRTLDESWEAATAIPRAKLSPRLIELVETALLASARQSIDPMELALKELATANAVRDPRDDAVVVHEYPMRPELLAMAKIWKLTDDPAYAVCAKGAPEAIAALCRPSEPHEKAIQRLTEHMARGGMRVLGVAYAQHQGPELPATPTAFGFRFLGLLGFADPLRDGVSEAIRECQSAGVRVMMITGDYPATAQAIARQAGIESPGIVTGHDLEILSDAALAERINGANVFARIAPHQKLKIVNALKAAGHVVAMTGDGVNDAPALKAAHIGIAMGGRGSDVAREASSIVLLNDDFSSIVRAIRLGRRIYDNLRKAMIYIVAVHVPIAGLALFPLLLGYPILLTPMIIALIELVIDPTCSVILEAEREEQDIMTRPPRDPDSSLLTPTLFTWGVVQGVLAFAGVATVFFVAVLRDLSEPEMRGITFVALIAANMALILNNRSFRASFVRAVMRPNPAMWWSFGATGLMLALILLIPAARALFGLGALHWDDVLPCFGLAMGLLLMLELIKPVWRSRLRF